MMSPTHIYAIRTVTPHVVDDNGILITRKTKVDIPTELKAGDIIINMSNYDSIPVYYIKKDIEWDKATIDGESNYILRLNSQKKHIPSHSRGTLHLLRSLTRGKIIVDVSEAPYLKDMLLEILHS